MKKIAALLLALLTLVAGAASYAAGGSTSDPLVSQSYVKGTFIPAVTGQGYAKADARLTAGYDDALARLKALAELQLARAGALSGGGGYAQAFTEGRFKRGDSITVDTGSQLLLLAGNVTLTSERGTVVDVTAGAQVPSGTVMADRHRYLAAEDSLCRATVTSDTAVLSLQGYYALTPSGEVDYFQLAGALGAMGLLRGTETAYGGGYDLERTPNRVEALVLFLRLIGEEKAALAFTGQCPFVDAPEWGKPYLAYAWEKGYTKGVDADGKYFDSARTINAREYLTFLLRALGYKENGETPDFTWDTTFARARDLGVITAGEGSLLEGPRPFLRAQTVYLSYYALSAPRKAGGTLQSHLLFNGALDSARVSAAQGGVTTKRVQ